MAAPVQIVNQAASQWPLVLAAFATGLAGLGGYWLAGRNEEQRDKRALDREVDVRRLERQQRLEDRAHDFQRDLLLEIHDELQKLIRVVAEEVSYDRKCMKEKGQFYLLPAGLSDEDYKLGVSIRRLVSRVLDDRLREAIEAFRGQCIGTTTLHIQLTGMGSEAAVVELDRYLNNLTQQYSDLSEILGTAVRAELGRVD